ncbi:xanthine dehydrogenase accessory protein XdhC [Polymorphum gilvum]|uniref:Xanthine dehydrogenase accessory protein XdhC n=1 Tax=Polymorphum gilvum (strain LMG 25793 / CGMCC 1.9160 / SL003B-26A1) TaxID=991905 RepID=F2IZU9_POLGS|nr:xanthine dehydrogenase accessory protein XdhC [Polymorphum gilvum]ADZ70675.1 Xanthine dehydrogenase accessory protein XdhC [Polymorphum gilvum SL003B-26A1]
MTPWCRILEAIGASGACALVTVACVRGSAPREQGARMLVRADGSVAGTIGGGTLEYEAIRWAREALAADHRGLVKRSVSLGPDLGQCCGGQVGLAIEVLGKEQRQEAERFAALERRGEAFSTRAQIEPGRPLVRDLVAPADGAPPFVLQDGVVVERFGSDRRPLYLFGAGHVGRATVLALAPLPFSVTWIDSRPDLFPAAMPGDVRCVVLDRPAEALAEAPVGAFVLVMTHSHALDEDIVAAALRAGRFSYVGLIGSATKRARFLSRLAKRGLAGSATVALVCPIGSAGVRSKLPAAIAACVAVELLEADEAARAKGHRDRVLARSARVGP